MSVIIELLAITKEEKTGLIVNLILLLVLFSIAFALEFRERKKLSNKDKRIDVLSEEQPERR